jgi:hypothetical protein
LQTLSQNFSTWFAALQTLPQNFSMRFTAQQTPSAKLFDAFCNAANSSAKHSGILLNNYFFLYGDTILFDEDGVFLSVFFVHFAVKTYLYRKGRKDFHKGRKEEDGQLRK